MCFEGINSYSLVMLVVMLPLWEKYGVSLLARLRRSFLFDVWESRVHVWMELMMATCMSDK